MKFLVFSIFVSSVVASASAPRVRTFHFRYNVMLKELPAQPKHVEVWIPLPHDDAYQQIRNLQIDSSLRYQISKAADGNTMLHVNVDDPNPAAFTISVNLDATREEHIQSRLFEAAKPIREDDSRELAQYLKPDRLVPIDGRIQTWAREVVEQAHARTDLEKARAIYNHVVSTVKYDKTGKGWGRGDIYYACDARRGNCTDFHAIFIGYARAVGIPARFAIGFPLPADRGEGQIAGYHCWAEFYAQGIGWVPVDASEAAKNPQKREYFFGAHDENRIELSKGRDLTLAPAQKGEPLNFFVNPYVEVNGEPFTGATIRVTYQDSDRHAKSSSLSNESGSVIQHRFDAGRRNGFLQRSSCCREGIGGSLSSGK